MEWVTLRFRKRGEEISKLADEHTLQLQSITPQRLPFSKTLLMSSDRWNRLQLLGTRNLVAGIEYAESLVVNLTAI